MRVAVLAFVLTSGVLLAGGPAAALADAVACAAAATTSEATLGLPQGLLLAIGQVESGRRDPGSGRLAPWPWTINVAGSGQYFDTAAEALAATRALLAKGVASIDIGCFQVNLAAHPDAFATLDAAFDPATNAHAAGRFLAALRVQTGNWEDAIAGYHSMTPERGIPYRQRVLAEWKQTPPSDTAPLLRMVTWTPPGNRVQVWMPSSGGAGPNIISLSAVPALPVIRTPAK